MINRPFSIAALAALALAAASPANAGSPCCCAPTCAAPAAPMMVYQPYELPQVYIVNQGPVFSGPGIYTRPQVVVPKPMSDYPYVGYDYPAYRDAYAPMPQYWHHRHVRSVPRGTLRRPPGWFDK